MAGRELPPTITPATALEAWNAMGDAWTHATGSPPSRATLACLVAQWAIETGWGQQMRGFNIGNVKATAKREGDYSFFTTSERLDPDAAESALAKAAPRTDTGGPNVAIPDWTPNEHGKIRVLFYPSHAACRFRAFASLEQGAAEQVRTLRSDFPATIATLEQGAPDPWARALHRSKYYTGNPDEYARTLVQIHADLLRRNYPMPGIGGGGGGTPPAPTEPGGQSLMPLLICGIALAFLTGAFR